MADAPGIVFVDGQVHLASHRHFLLDQLTLDVLLLHLLLWLRLLVDLLQVERLL